MNTFITPQNIVFSLGIIGMIFGIYKMFHDPQVELDKQQDLDKQKSGSDVKLLGYQITADREATDRRFSEVMARMDTALTLAQNHTHTVDVKVDALTGVVNVMNVQITKEMTRLGTIIEERFPKK